MEAAQFLFRLDILQDAFLIVNVENAQNWKGGMRHMANMCHFYVYEHH